ncbi:MAG: PEGA domain-containing protein [Candidatus Omnitrophota bacterium]
MRRAEVIRIAITSFFVFFLLLSVPEVNADSYQERLDSMVKDFVNAIERLTQNPESGKSFKKLEKTLEELDKLREDLNSEISDKIRKKKYRESIGLLNKIKPPDMLNIEDKIRIMVDDAQNGELAKEAKKKGGEEAQRFKEAAEKDESEARRFPEALNTFFASLDSRVKQIEELIEREKGKIEVSTVPPSAFVYLDREDKPRGETTSIPILIADIPVGEHILRIEKPDYETVKTTVTVSFDKIEEKSFTLIPLPGTCTITSEPEEVTVYFNDKKYEKKRETLSLEKLPIGRYSMKVTAALYIEQEKEVEIKSNQKTPVHFRLDRQTGTVSVGTEPSGAEVYLDNEETSRGTTPCSIEVFIGEHNIKMTKERYETVNRKVIVKYKEVSPVSAPNLIPLPPDGNLVRTIKVQSPVNSASFSPDGLTALSGSADGVVGLWDIRTGGLIKTISAHDKTAYFAVFSADGKMSVSGSSDRTIKLWDTETGDLLWLGMDFDNYPLSAAFSPDGRYILSGYLDGTIKQWDVKNGTNIRTISGHTAAVWSVSISPSGKDALSASKDKTVRLWESNNGRNLKTFNDHNDIVYTVSFSRDGKYALSGGDDKKILLWDIEQRKMVRTFTGHKTGVTSAVFSPEGIYIVSGSKDGIIKIWDRENGECLRTYTAHDGLVNSVVFSPDGRYILSGSEDGTIKLWK